MNKCIKFFTEDYSRKRPKTPFIFFAMEHRPVLRVENPEMSQKDITRKLGSIYMENKDTDEFQKYKNTAKEEKKKYLLYKKMEKCR
jgi:hypothetical protein